MSKILIALMIFIILPVPALGIFPHRNYDWEGDNVEETPPAANIEPCYACHYGAMAGLGRDKPRKKCEDCHTVNATTGQPNGPYKLYSISRIINFSLREDYTAPLVYSHLKVSNPKSYSTCLNYDEETGEGVCHGVSNEFGKELGGYYAFNQTQHRKMSKDYPNTRSASKQFLPNSTDCLFCHFQAKRKLAKAWGDAPQVIPVLHAQSAETGGEVTLGCIDCHLKKDSVLMDFHSAGIYVERKEGESSSLPFGVILLAFLLLLVVGIWFSRKLLSKKKDVNLEGKD